MDAESIQIIKLVDKYIKRFLKKKSNIERVGTFVTAHIPINLQQKPSSPSLHSPPPLIHTEGTSSSSLLQEAETRLLWAQRSQSPALHSALPPSPLQVCWQKKTVITVSAGPPAT